MISAMRRHGRRQIRFLFGSINSFQRIRKSVSTAAQVVVSWWRESKVGIRRRTQNPALSEHAGSIPASGTPYVAKTYPLFWFEPPRTVKFRADKKSDKSRRIAWVLAVQQAERDREIAAINCALRSGTAAKVLG